MKKNQYNSKCKVILFQDLTSGRKEQKMKIKLNGYEVEVKAKCINERYSEKETMNFLNWLSLMLDDLTKYNRSQGYEKFAQMREEEAINIYNMLAEKGLYK